MPRRPAAAPRVHAVAARALGLLLAAAALVGSPRPGPAPAHAAPTVAIRTRAEVTLRSIRRDDDGVVVRGELRDRATGLGLGGEEVRVTIGGGFAVATSAPDGTFEVRLFAAPGPVDVRLDFPGGDGIDPGFTELGNLDPTKAPVDLTLTADVTPAGVLVTVIATVDGAPQPLPVTIRVSPTDHDTPFRDFPTRANVPTTIRRADALGAGARRLTARYDGDAGHAAATATTIVQLASSTRTTLAFVDDEVAFDSTVRARGEVVDADGTPLPRIAVSLYGAGRRRLGSAVTGKDGHYAIDVEADLIGTGRHGLVAAAETREAWLLPGESLPAFITVGPPRPAPVAITIAAFAATALTALGFIYARRRREERARAPASPESRAAEEPRGGLEVGRASLVSTLRRASDHGFAGMVRDSVRGRPLAGATVVLSFGLDARRTDSADDGRFAVEQLGPGEWTARVAAPGHVAERFTVSIPHRGELRGVRVDLVPVRERVFAIYRHAALPLLPRPDLWGIWSPRQIVDHVRAQRPPVALAALTSLVEEVYFSSRLSEEVLLVEAEARAAAAIAERAGGLSTRS